MKKMLMAVEAEEEWQTRYRIAEALPEIGRDVVLEEGGVMGMTNLGVEFDFDVYDIPKDELASLAGLRARLLSEE